MRFTNKVYLVILSLLVSVGLVTAQESCPNVVDDAAFALNNICLNIGRNQACYGNGEIVAIPQSGASVQFDLPGDIAEVDDIASLSLSPFDTNLDEWGVAVLVLQADIPDTVPGQNVTMLLFGDTSLSNDNGAYYFTGGIGTPSCNQAPNGILIQTPEGVGEVSLTLNGINISLGSTLYLSFEDEEELLLALLEGAATLETDDDLVDLIVDTFTTVFLDEEGNAIGDFADPESLEDLELPTLPVVFLPEPLDDDSDMDDSEETVEVSGDVIIPQSGAWSTTAGEFAFSDGCPAQFSETINSESLAAYGVVEGTTIDLDFSEGDILGPLFLDLAEPAFSENGITLTTDQPENNVYVVTITFEEGAIVITQTYTIQSSTVVEAVQVQEYNLGVIECTVETSFSFEYAG